MMISKEQAHAAAEGLRNRGSRYMTPTSVDVSPEVLAAAFAVAESTPDTSPSRMAEAERYLASDGADSRVVASMMIQRIISDSLR
jgi:hypothetical protein